MMVFHIPACTKYGAMSFREVELRFNQRQDEKAIEKLFTYLYSGPV